MATIWVIILLFGRQPVAPAITFGSAADCEAYGQRFLAMAPKVYRYQQDYICLPNR